MRNSRRLEEGTINQESVVWSFREAPVFKNPVNMRSSRNAATREPYASFFRRTMAVFEFFSLFVIRPLNNLR